MTKVTSLDILFFSAFNQWNKITKAGRDICTVYGKDVIKKRIIRR